MTDENIDRRIQEKRTSVSIDINMANSFLDQLEWWFVNPLEEFLLFFMVRKKHAGFDVTKYWLEDREIYNLPRLVGTVAEIKMKLPDHLQRLNQVLVNTSEGACGLKLDPCYITCYITINPCDRRRATKAALLETLDRVLEEMPHDNSQCSTTVDSGLEETVNYACRSLQNMLPKLPSMVKSKMQAYLSPSNICFFHVDLDVLDHEPSVVVLFTRFLHENNIAIEYAVKTRHGFHCIIDTRHGKVLAPFIRSHSKYTNKTAIGRNVPGTDFLSFDTKKLFALPGSLQGDHKVVPVVLHTDGHYQLIKFEESKLGV